jgi:hypothetical protein
MSLGSYLVLIDNSGRLFREGKAAISAGLAVLLSDGRVDMAVGGQRVETGVGRVNVVGRAHPKDAISRNPFSVSPFPLAASPFPSKTGP